MNGVHQVSALQGEQLEAAERHLARLPAVDAVYQLRPAPARCTHPVELQVEDRRTGAVWCRGCS